jgi:transcriptional regulator with XRE-family HTH domain
VFFYTIFPEASPGHDGISGAALMRRGSTGKQYQPLPGGEGTLYCALARRVQRDCEYTQGEMARRYDVSERTIQRWLAADASPRAQHIQRILQDVSDQGFPIITSRAALSRRVRNNPNHEFALNHRGEIVAVSEGLRQLASLFPRSPFSATHPAGTYLDACILDIFRYLDSTSVCEIDILGRTETAECTLYRPDAGEVWAVFEIVSISERT